MGPFWNQSGMDTNRAKTGHAQQQVSFGSIPYQFQKKTDEVQGVYVELFGTGMDWF